VSGGAVDVYSGVAPPPPLDLTYVRGGKASVVLYNSVSFNWRVTVYHIRTLNNGTASGIPSIVSTGWDPSFVTRFYEQYKVVSAHNFLLGPQSSQNAEISKFIPRMRVKNSDFNSGNIRDYWVIKADALDTLSAVNLGVDSTYTLSFSQLGN